MRLRRVIFSCFALKKVPEQVTRLHLHGRLEGCPSECRSRRGHFSLGLCIGAGLFTLSLTGAQRFRPKVKKWPSGATDRPLRHLITLDGLSEWTDGRIIE